MYGDLLGVSPTLREPADFCLLVRASSTQQRGPPTRKAWVPRRASHVLVVASLEISLEISLLDISCTSPLGCIMQGTHDGEMHPAVCPLRRSM